MKRAPFCCHRERESFCFASKPRKKKTKIRENKSDVAKRVW